MSSRGHKVDGFTARDANSLPKNQPENHRRCLTLVDDAEPIEEQIARWVRRCKRPSAYTSAGITFEGTCRLEMADYERYGYALVSRHDSNSGATEFFGDPARIRINRRNGTFHDFEVWEQDVAHSVRAGE